MLGKLFGKKAQSPEETEREKQTEDALETVYCPIRGTTMLLEETSDPVFSGKVLGDGIVIVPTEGKVYSPVDGVISTLMDTLHALCITSKDGTELMIHVGRDTVNLKGGPFTGYVKEGEEVKKGQLLLAFDIPAIQAAGLDIATPVIICSGETIVSRAEHKEVKPGDVLMTLRHS